MSDISEPNGENSQGNEVSDVPFMSTEYWSQRWENNDYPWHKGDIHYFLTGHYDEMTDMREKLRIFFPLCGKALDMKWIADKGHTVVGLEYSHLAIQSFFQEHDIKYTTEDLSDEAKLFKSDDGSVNIVACDFFKATVEILGGPVDAVWDRGSLSAILKEDRQRYAEIMKNVLKPDGRILLATHVYDETKYGGPPQCIPNEVVTELYGDDYDVIELEDKDAFNPARHIEWGISALHEKALLIKRKTVDK